MRYDEPDTRDAYRQGARDVFEALSSSLKAKQIKEFEAWLQELDSWGEFDPPLPPSPDYR